MATTGVMVIFTASLLVLHLLVFSTVESHNAIFSNENLEDLGPANATAAGTAALVFPSEAASEPLLRGDVQCPAVCPGCPACPSPPPCPRVVPPGYRYHEGLGYYKMHYEEKSWDDAKAACEREGGYLVVLNSEEEANMTSRFVEKYGIDSYVHVGFFDVTKKKYITVLDEPLASTGYVVWAPGEPNGVGKEKCGSFKKYKGLNDITCSAKNRFLCELFV